MVLFQCARNKGSIPTLQRQELYAESAPLVANIPFRYRFTLRGPGHLKAESRKNTT